MLKRIFQLSSCLIIMLNFSPVYSADFTAFKYCYETEKNCSAEANRDVCCQTCKQTHLNDAEEQYKQEAYKQCMGL